MEVILLQRIEKLGQMGDIVAVKDGYARNFLLKKKFAVRATAEKIEEFKAKKAQLEAHNLKLKAEAEAVAGKMEGAQIVLIRQAGDAGNLYGSVRRRDIAEGLTDQGFTVTSAQVQIKQPIKTLGIHSVSIVLHPEVSIDVTANVALSEEEAVSQQNSANTADKSE